jgi:HPr kinase/phosphorylase
VEIRGLGILNIRELFGVSAVSGPKQIGLGIRLERWDESKEIDRLGLDARTVPILEVPVPYFILPVSPGRNLATLVETAVRVHLLSLRGYNAAELFVERHDRALRTSAGTTDAEARARGAEDDGASDGV